MTIDEAIKTLEQNTKIDIPPGEIAHLDATRLGIEALKWFMEWRAPQYPAPYIRLPGETED